jgi:hypothetical protein
MLEEGARHLDSLLEHVSRHKREVEAYEAELLERREALSRITP